VFHLDHMALGVADLSEGARRFREETGFGAYDGGRFRGSSLGNWIVPLGGDVYVEVEGVAEGADGDGGALSDPASWFDRATRDGGDRWMFWCLRADTLEELQQVADRLGGEVHRVPGRVEPDGTQRVITSAPGGSLTRDVWKRGLPNWYYRPDPDQNPARRTVTGKRVARGVAWLEVGGEEEELMEHIGEETYETLPLRVVPGAPGLHAVAIRTEGGEEIVIRRPPVDQGSF
jgi:hypothetical protein